MDRAAGAAAIFGTANAQHAKTCRHEVEHLADRLADRMERTAAARADVRIYIELNVLARQMIGQSPVLRRRFGGGIVRRWLRMTCLETRNIGVEVFQSEGKLVAIDPFRPPPELRSLKPRNDKPGFVDFGLGLRSK